MRERELGEILVAAGVLSDEQLALALDYLDRTAGVAIGEALEALGIADEVSVVKILCRHFRLPFVDLSRADIDAQVIALVPEAVARENGIIPVKLRGEVLILATIHPWAAASASELGIRVDHRLAFALTDSSGLRDALRRHY